MKIFFPLGAFYPSQIGGPCNTLYWHTCELNKNNIKTSVVSTTLGIKKGKVIENQLLESDYGKLYYGTGNAITLKTIKIALINIKDSDIIHLNSLFSTISIICFLFTKFFYRKKKVVFSVRGELSKDALKFSSWKKKPILFLYKGLNQNVVYHSTSTQETFYIQTVFKNSAVFEIPNLIKPYERLFLIRIKRQILYVGRIHPIKALHKIIEGLSLSKSFIDSDFKFVVVGTYEERHLAYYNELVSLIKEKGIIEKVEFKGHLVGKEKEIAYAESSWTLLLSESENFGNVVLESLNQGTPVIASMGTPWSILEKSGCGFHISNDPNIIASNIDKIINFSSDEYSRYRQNAVKLIDNNFNITTQIPQWIKQYENILNAKK